MFVCVHDVYDVYIDSASCIHEIQTENYRVWQQSPARPQSSSIIIRVVIRSIIYRYTIFSRVVLDPGCLKTHTHAMHVFFARFVRQMSNVLRDSSSNHSHWSHHMVPVSAELPVAERPPP